VKLTAQILLYTFLVLTTLPCATLIASKMKTGCETECAMAEQKEKMECCPIDMCCVCQCCCCCFACTLDTKQIIFKVFDSSLNKRPTASEFVLPGFTADSWQPPEIA